VNYTCKHNSCLLAPGTGVWAPPNGAHSVRAVLGNAAVSAPNACAMGWPLHIYIYTLGAAGNQRW
jgi:hypothetical protein